MSDLGSAFSARTRQIAGVLGMILIVAFIGLMLANRPFGGVGSQDGPDASASPVPSDSLTASAASEPSPSLGPTNSSNPSPISITSPTPSPTAAPTAAPAPHKPTPTPVPAMVHCVPEPNGWAVYVQHDPVPGGSMTVDLQGFPTGQKMTLKVDYPDGSTVPMGNRYAGAPDAVGWTHMAWTWTVPAAMTSGAAKASWSGTCIEGRNENGYGDFTVIGPAPTPNWSVWSTAYQAWPGGPGQVEVQAYYGAICTVTVTYPDARTQIVGTIEYVGTQLSFLWTVPTDVPIGTGSYHISCSLNGAIRTGDGALIITAHP